MCATFDLIPSIITRHNNSPWMWWLLMINPPTIHCTDSCTQAKKLQNDRQLFNKVEPLIIVGGRAAEIYVSTFFSSDTRLFISSVVGCSKYFSLLLHPTRMMINGSSVTNILEDCTTKQELWVHSRAVKEYSPSPSPERRTRLGLATALFWADNFNGSG